MLSTMCCSHLWAYVRVGRRNNQEVASTIDGKCGRRPTDASATRAIWLAGGSIGAASVWPVDSPLYHIHRLQKQSLWNLKTSALVALLLSLVQTSFVVIILVRESSLTGYSKIKKTHASFGMQLSQVHALRHERLHWSVIDLKDTTSS